MTAEDFTPEQQEYLKGLFAGIAARRGGGAVPDPSDLQRAAQDSVITAGGTLVPEEEAKRRKHPLDRFGEIAALAAEQRFPRGTDVFLAKFHGLFYVAPAQNSFMCRLRIPGGILNAHQVRGVADIADGLAGGTADITTRANLQIREIPAANAPEILLRLSEIGLTSRGAGADNVRNITGSPTAGIDRQELIDTRPQVRAIHHHILYHRELYGLPRKFNIAFDGGGSVAVLEDTNDIAFSAVQAEDRVAYRLALGGITGHRDFARETGVLVDPADTTRVCDAILRVFIRHGTRTDRTRARLKYLLDDWGLPKFLQEVERTLGERLTRVDAAAIRPRPAQDRLGHVGVHAQKQAGLSYIGVLAPGGRLTTSRLRGLAAVADRFGSGTIRLTVWQNLLVSDIPDHLVPATCDAIAALGLATTATPLRAGMVACTGNAGCKFAAGDTKSHAAALADWVGARSAIDRPINIHLTGCPHSCAQHYIADIGLLAVKVECGEDSVEGYDIHVGGGAGAARRIGRMVRAGVPFDSLPPMILAILSAWQSENRDQDFQVWSSGKSDAAISALCDAALATA